MKLVFLPHIKLVFLPHIKQTLKIIISWKTACMAAPQCCWCNGQSHCQRCSCSHSGVPCSNCVPRQSRRCKNVKTIAVTSPSLQPLALSGGLPPFPSCEPQGSAIPFDSGVPSHDSDPSSAISGRISPLLDPPDPVLTHIPSLLLRC